MNHEESVANRRKHVFDLLLLNDFTARIEHIIKQACKVDYEAHPKNVQEDHLQCYKEWTLVTILSCEDVACCCHCD